MRLPLLAFLACVTLLTDACAHAPGYPPEPVQRPTDITSFTTLYSQNCAACHGANGQNGPAIDLANPEYQALIDDATLRKWISSGVPGSEMPAFAQSAGGMLTDAQVNALIAGMRKEWSRPNAFAGATPPPYAQAKPGDPQRGEAAYQSHCASCHAASPQQVTSPIYLDLVADQNLRSIIIAGRPDIHQPDWSHDAPCGKASTPLTSQEVDDIVTYLSGLRTAAQQATPQAPSGQIAKPASGRR